MCCPTMLVLHSFFQYVADVVEGRLSIVHGDILNFDISDSFPCEHAKEWLDGMY